MSNEHQMLIAAKLGIDRTDYIHNDLSNAAFHILKRVQAAQNEDRREGIGLDIMAAIVMTAFAFEAYLNFVGYNVLEKDWPERDSFIKKIEFLLKKLSIDFDWNIRPFSTLQELHKIRNILAHGKPQPTKRDWESVGTHDELQMELRSFVPDWRAGVSYEFLERAFEDVDAVWRLLLDTAGITSFDTLSGGSSSIEFIKFIGDN